MTTIHATRPSLSTCSHCFEDIADGSHAECPSGVACPWCFEDIALGSHAECITVR